MAKTTVEEFSQYDITGWITVEFCEICLCTDKKFVVLSNRGREHFVLCTDCMTEVAHFKQDDNLSLRP